jgi:flagellar biosynthetic protein FlhB
MAGQDDKESRTEEPTEKKVADAVEKGNVPRSRDISIFASLLGILAAAALFVGPGALSLANTIATLLDHPDEFAVSTGDEANQLLSALSLEVGRFLLPTAGVLMIAGVGAALFQHAPSFALEQIRPQWSRVSPVAGWSRVFGGRGLVEFLKAVFKLAVVGGVALILLNSYRQEAVATILSDPTSLPGVILDLGVRLLAAIAVSLVIMVAADVVWTRFRWRADLRMTRQELKDEVRQSEGDPLVKSRLRSLARDRARRRMIAAVPTATVVIANPTHYAVALKYDRAKGGAPIVVAKGVDLVALRIREVAERHAVPVIEDRPLARALYDAIDIDQWITPEFYRAIAKILHFLYSRAGQPAAVRD